MSHGDWDLTGRVALVTGAAGGIGTAVAARLGRYGARVIVVDLSSVMLANLDAHLKGADIDSLALPVDVSDGEAVTQMMNTAQREFGVVDLVVNNAAVTSHTAPEEVSLADWQRVIDVDLTGYFLVAAEAGRRLLASGHEGTIVNMSSIAGSTALGRGNFAYSVAKGGVLQLTRELAVEWSRAGIRVNAIQPCQVNTSALRALIESRGASRDELLTEMVRGIPLGRLAEAEDIAAAVHFLSSSAAAMITGVTLPVNGGNLALNAGGSLRPAT